MRIPLVLRVIPLLALPLLYFGVTVFRDSTNAVAPVPILSVPSRPGIPVPCLVVTASDQPTLLARLWGSIDVPVTRLLVLQAGPHGATRAALARWRRIGETFSLRVLPAPAAASDLWNAATAACEGAAFVVVVDERVALPPGALADLCEAASTELQLVGRNDSNRVLFFPAPLSSAVSAWSLFALLPLGVQRVGPFDRNLALPLHTGRDFLIRLSRADLWARVVPVPDGLTVNSEPLWAENASDASSRARHLHADESYLALKWGQARTAGVFDTNGSWDRHCDAGTCRPVAPVLYPHPFSDRRLPLSFAPFDAARRQCLAVPAPFDGAAPRCPFNRTLLPRPGLLPSGPFNGTHWTDTDAGDTKPYKPFAYLLMGARVVPTRPPLHPGPSRDVLWLTYADRSGDVHYPKSTWTQGRNRLLDFAMRRAAEMRDGGYLYYIFMDGDVLLKPRPEQRYWYRSDLPDNVFDRFEMFLTDWEPAVGSVPFRWTLGDQSTFSIHQNNDAIFSAHHRETISFVMPYVGDLDCFSWYYSQHIFNSLNAMIHNTHRVQFNAIEAHNDQHNPYAAEMWWIRPSCYAVTATLPESPLRRTLVADPNPSYTPGQPEPRGNTSYIVPLDYIHKHFNTSHPIIARVLAFRQRPVVQHLLAEAQRVAPGRYRPDHRTCSPEGPPDHRCFSETCPPKVFERCKGFDPPP